MLLVTGVVGLAALAIVLFTSAQASSRHLSMVERYIEEGIKSKGKVLTENHALALRSLTLDNAFLDMQRLVARAVHEDADLYFGLYVNSQGQTLAYARAGAEPKDDPTGGDADERAEDTEHQAFTELQLTPKELLQTQASIAKTVRLGKSLLEVAVPVLGEEGEFIGTIRYGLSTDRMQDALLKAQAEASERLQRSLVLVGSLVSVAVLMGLLLSRMQGGRITRPVRDLTLAAQSLASGNRDVRVKIESRDELELLGASFNRMVEDLDASYKDLEEMNRTLEQKVARRTIELAHKNRDMRLVLDNVDQGFATLSPEGTIGIECSRVLAQWFGECSEPVPFWRYMQKVSPEFASRFQLGWEQVIDDFLPLEVSLSQLPVELASQGRIFSLRYLPFHRDERLEGILLVIADETERRSKARQEAEHAELTQVFKKLMLDREGFGIFVRETEQFLSVIAGPGSNRDEGSVKRALHTLKGNAGAMGLGVLAELCHQLEDELALNPANIDTAAVKLANRWSTISEHIRGLTNQSREAVVEVPTGEYVAVLEGLSAEALTPREVLRQMLDWKLEPASRFLTRLAEQARTLARRLDKGDIEICIEANELRLDSDRFAAFFSDVVHVIRNAVDHGLETPEERVQSSKPTRGKLVFSANAANDVIEFEFADDGRGIDWEAIRRKASELGLEPATEGQLLRALCQEGVTTCEAPTLISGRGVGMAAVRQRVAAMNGSMEVRSVSGQGTTWVFRFPTSTSQVSTVQPRTGPFIRVAAGRSEGRG